MSNVQKELFTIRYLLFTIRYSPFAIHYLLFAIRPGVSWLKLANLGIIGLQSTSAFLQTHSEQHSWVPEVPHDRG